MVPSWDGKARSRRQKYSLGHGREPGSASSSESCSLVFVSSSMIRSEVSSADSSSCCTWDCPSAFFSDSLETTFPKSPLLLPIRASGALHGMELPLEYSAAC